MSYIVESAGSRLNHADFKSAVAAAASAAKKGYKATIYRPLVTYTPGAPIIEYVAIPSGTEYDAAAAV